MAVFINIVTMEYPRYPGDIQIIYPEWNTGQPLPEGWKEVIEITQPTPSEGKYIVESFPESVDGIWYQKWIEAEITEPMKYEKRLKNIQDLVRLGLTQEEAEALVK